MSNNRESAPRPVISPYSPIEHFVSMFAGRMGYLDVICEDMWGIMKAIEDKENKLDEKLDEIISATMQSPECENPTCKEIIRLLASLYNVLLELKREKGRFEDLKGETDRFIDSMTQEDQDAAPSSSTADE